MELAGTLAENLEAAIVSARRLRGHRVHSDTVKFWHELLDHARLKARRSVLPDAEDIYRLIAELQSELAAGDQEARNQSRASGSA